VRDPGALSGCETWQVFEKCFFFPLLASVGMRLIALLLQLLLLSLCLAKPIEHFLSGPSMQPAAHRPPIV
jgi:hypothetical protein